MDSLLHTPVSEINRMPLSSKREVIKFVHRKLLFRLRRLLVIFIVITGILFYEIAHDYIAGITAFAGFIIGISIGLLAGKRMHKISWDAEASKVVTRMDKLGIIILIAYLIFSVLRHWLLSHFFEGHALSAFSLSVAAGGMLGRLYLTRQSIRKVLKSEGILNKVKADKRTS